MPWEQFLNELATASPHKAKKRRQLIILRVAALGHRRVQAFRFAKQPLFRV
jgi:hypothetical protein